MRHFFIRCLFLLLMLCCFSPHVFAQTLVADIIIATDGVAPFDLSSAAGNDEGPANGIVRTNDQLILEYQVTVNGTAGQVVENVTFTGTVSAELDFTLPVDCLTGGTPNSQIIGNSFVCNVGDISVNDGLQEYSFPATVSHLAQNGDVVGISSASVFADAQPTQNFTGQTASVSAAPAYDIVTSGYGQRGGQYIVEGPVSNPGTLVIFPIVIRGDEDPRGDEALTSSSISFDLSDISPNAQLYQGWAGSYVNACDPNGAFLSTPPKRRVSIGAGGPGGNDSGQERNSVWDTGTITCADTGAGTAANINITNTDFRPRQQGATRRYPDLRGGGVGGEQPQAGAHYASTVIVVFVPISDLNISGNTPFSASFTTSAVSSNGANIDPDSTNETISGIINSVSSYRDLFYGKDIDSSLSIPSLDGTPSVFVDDGKISNGQVFRSLSFQDNRSLNADFTDTILCQIWDNNTHVVTNTGQRGVYAEIQTYGGPSPNVSPVEYGVLNSFSSNGTCEDVDATWGVDPTALPGGVNAVNAVRVTADIPRGSIGTITPPTVRLWVYHEPVSGLSAGTEFANYGPIRNDMLFPALPGNWRISNYNPVTNNGVYGTSAILAAIDVEVEKHEINDATSVVAGNTYTYELLWSATVPGNLTASTLTDVTVTDTLPENMSYVAGSSNVTPQSITSNMDGTTTVVWFLPDTLSTATQTPITYDVTINVAVPDNTVLDNEVVIAAPEDSDPVIDNTDNYAVTITNPNVLLLGNTVSTAILPTVAKDGVVGFVMSYQNVDDTDRPDLDIVNIFPHPDAPTSPVSNFSGTLVFQSVTLGVNVTGDEVFYYTKTPAASIVPEGDDPSNALATGSTVWCTSFSGGTCPANASEVTAIRLINGVIPAAPPSPGIAPVYGFTTQFVASGFSIGGAGLADNDTYTNSFTLQSSDLAVDGQATPTTAIIGEADLSITKEVITSPINVGDPITYRLTVANDGVHDSSGVMVGDVLPADINYSSDTGAGAYVPGTGVWTIGSLPANSSATLDITAFTTTLSTITNEAEIIASDYLDPDSRPEDSFAVDDLGDAIIDDDEVGLSFDLLPKLYAEQIVVLVNNNNGTFTANVTITVDNIQAADVFDLQVFNNLADAFGVLNNDANLTAGEYEISATPAVSGLTSPDNITANGSFNGASNQSMLAYNAGDSLTVGNSVTVSYSARFVPDFSASSTIEYISQVIASGDITDNNMLGDSATGIDASDDPNDTENEDPNLDGNPDDPNDFNTELLNLIANAATFEKSYAPITDNNNGTYSMTFQLDVSNIGDAPLYDLQITELLEHPTRFGTYVTANPPTNLGEYSVVSVTGSISNDAAPLGDSQLPAINTNFTGQVGNETLLIPTLGAGDALGVGDTLQLQVSIVFLADVSLSGPGYLNSAVFTADLIEDGITANSISTYANISDDPTNSADVDMDGDGDPDDPNKIRDDLPSTANTVFEKTASAVTDNGNGTYDVTFTIDFMNNGSTTLYDVQLSDNLVSVFGDYEANNVDVDMPGEYTFTATPSFTFTDAAPTGHNVVSNMAAYTGQAGADTILIPTNGASIGYQDTLQIQFFIRFFPDLSAVSTFENQARFQGDALEDGTVGNSTHGVDGVDDLSDDPTVNPSVDVDGDGDPDDPTVITLPLAAQLGIAQEAIVTGNQVDLIVTLENFSNFQLTHFSVPLDLDAIFGANNYTVQSITSSNAIENAAFTGTGSNTQIVQSSAMLAVGDVQTITISMVIDQVVDQGFGAGSYESSITGTASDPADTISDTDISQNGLNTDPDGDDDPDNNSVITPINIASLDLNKTVDYVRSAGVVDQYDVGFRFTLENKGGGTLTDITLTDDFIGQNPTQIASLDAVFAGNIVVVENDATTSFTAGFDPAFIQNPTANAFTGGVASLDAGDVLTLTVNVRFTVDSAAILTTPITNSAIAGGLDSGGNNVADVSDNNTPNDGSFDDVTTVEILPTGIVYWANTGQPLEGATIALLDAGGNALPNACLVAGQQGQETGVDGQYRLDMLWGAAPACPVSGSANYTISIITPSGYGAPSLITPPTDTLFDGSLCQAPATFDAYQCKIGANPLNVGYVDLNSSTSYYYGFTLGANGPQIVNNHLPLDASDGDTGGIFVTKRAHTKTTSVGEVVTWTITVTSNRRFDSEILDLMDTMPIGFTYVPNSASMDGVSLMDHIDGNHISWEIGSLVPDQTVTITLATRVNVGAKLGKATNSARALFDGQAVSNVATASITVVAEPIFDCSDIIGTVFYDKNFNGYRDKGESGIAAAVLYTLDGLKIQTDSHGKFHVACAAIPHAQRGSNFGLKLDTRSLPSGYRITTENPLITRVTRGKMAKMNFGVNIARVVEITIQDAIFKDCDTDLNHTSYDYVMKMLNELQKEHSVLRISYHTQIGYSFAEKRLDHLRKSIHETWKRKYQAPYALQIEEHIVERRSKNIRGCYR